MLSGFKRVTYSCTPVILLGVCRMLTYLFLSSISLSLVDCYRCCFCTQDFELEVTGAHIIKVNIFSKQLLKEETYAHGKIRVSHITTSPLCIALYWQETKSVYLVL